jgi:hypothetical protein
VCKIGLTKAHLPGFNTDSAPLPEASAEISIIYCHIISDLKLGTVTWQHAICVKYIALIVIKMAKKIHMKVGGNYCTRGLVYLHVAVQGPKADHSLHSACASHPFPQLYNSGHVLYIRS